MRSFRHDRDRRVENFSEFGVPTQAMDVEELRARRIAEIGRVPFAAGQFEQQPGIDSAGADPSGFGCRASVGDLVEQPGDLRGGEKRVDAEAGFGGEDILDLRPPQRREPLGGAPALPDHTWPERLARRAVPEKYGFALIGDADRGELDLRTGLEAFACRLLNRSPDRLA